MYKETIPKPSEAVEKTIINVGSEIELDVSQLKNITAPGDDTITNIMMKHGGIATTVSIGIFV